jgi:peptide methionine sulfoxide reductase msrA/msrB
MQLPVQPECHPDTARLRPLSMLWLTLAFALVGCSRTDPQPSAPNPNFTANTMTNPTHQNPAPATTETAIMAGGCFWGVEELLRVLPGVVASDVGYTGGQVASPTYSDVKTGRSGHAEAVRIVFDPSVLSYEQLLLYFFKIHDPTTKNRQGNDVGTQYRSAIFYQSPAQQQTALAVIDRVNKSGAWKAPVSTEVVAGVEYTPAEEYHQDYLQKHPNGYTCHFERDVNFY